jgi:hypothetical protein
VGGGERGGEGVEGVVAGVRMLQRRGWRKGEDAGAQLWKTLADRRVELEYSGASSRGVKRQAPSCGGTGYPRQRVAHDAVLHSVATMWALPQ